MSNSTAAHRDDSHRKSRAVRLGAILLAVVGVTAAATSAGFSNDAWFSANASSANVSLQGKLATDDDSSWTAADSNQASIAIPAGVFANMVPGETRTVTVDLKNAGSTDLALSEKTNTTGDILSSANTDVTVTFDQTGNLAAGDDTTATITIAPKENVWNTTPDLQNGTGSLTVDFTGTTVVADND